MKLSPPQIGDRKVSYHFPVLFGQGTLLPRLNAPPSSMEITAALPASVTRQASQWV